MSIQGFRFYVSELKRLDKFLISCDVYLSKHFHQKIRQAIFTEMTTLYLLILENFLLSSQSNFVLLLFAAKTVNKQASFMLLIR